MPHNQRPQPCRRLLARVDDWAGLPIPDQGIGAPRSLVEVAPPQTPEQGHDGERAEHPAHCAEK